MTLLFMRYLLILFLLYFSVYSFSQYPDSILHEKYSFYRERFNNAFIYKSADPGGSNPVSIRKPDNTANFGADCTIELGWYIGVLGTECKMLYDQGKDITGTVDELWHALYAINRMDIKANELYGSEKKGLDGFLIRGDAPNGYIENNKDIRGHFNREDTGTGRLKYCKYRVLKTRSVLSVSEKRGDPDFPEISHDQVWHLLLGLTLTIKSLGNMPDIVLKDPKGDPLQFQDSIISIRQEAQEIMKRLVSNLHRNNFYMRNNGSGKKVHTGCNAIVFKTPALTACNIFAGTDYRTGSVFWQPLKRINIRSQEYKSIVNAAYSDSWHNMSGTNITAKIISKKAIKDNSEILIFVHQFLFDTIYDHSFDAVKLMELAPKEGPYNDGTYKEYEWSSTHRFVHPKLRGQSPPSFPGEYNGLDYMLLHNLYYLLKKTSKSKHQKPK